MSLNDLIIAASESGSSLNPWAVGGGVLALFLVFLVALVAFGGGREHS